MKVSSRKGFTLIELLVVIAIIALLSSVVLAALSSARAKARDARRISDIRQIQRAVDLYADDHGGLFPNSVNFVTFSDPASTTSWGAKRLTSSGLATWDSDFLPLLAPYMTRLPRDPINVAPYSYDYIPEGYGQCPSSAPVGSTTRYSIIFSSEVSVFNLPLLQAPNYSGAAGRYCITP
ncbi:MAG TPA: type II secretion system protein [Candidatus Paceibacterota bacterium]|nr:type II secretion system protein [Candidatus Paceibacterota bacterium]